MDHFPFQVITTGSPMIMVDSFITINGNEVLLGISCQFTIKLSGSYDGLFILGKALGCLLDDGKDFRHHFVKCFLVNVEYFFLNLVNLSKDICTLVNRRVFNSCLQFSNLCFLRICRVLYLLLQFFCTLTKRIVIQRFYFNGRSFGLLHKWLD